MTPASGKAARARTAERFPLGKILVADGDPELLGAIEAALRTEGHEVVTATTGWETLRVAREQLPWLIIVDATMPDVSGYEICRRLRSDWHFAARSIILLASDSPKQRSLGLAAGADDFVLKPLDLVELADRVRLTQRRLAEMRSSSPLTGLPGNVYIQRELERRVAAGGLVALLYVDLDHFKAYNDHYGFLGHVGGDDFVILARADEAERIAQDVISGFETIVTDLYEPEDAVRGWFEVTDRRGNKRRQGLLTISTGVATSLGRTIEDHRRLVDLASEMKEFAKSRLGNYVAVDRRSERDLGPGGGLPRGGSTSSERGVLAGQVSWGDRRGPGLTAVTPTFGPTARSTALRRKPRRGLVKYAAAAMVALGLAGGPATVVLAENARPGGVLWSVKLWVENTRLVLERDEGKDVVLRLEFATRRVGGLLYVTAVGGPATLVEKVTENLAEHTQAAILTYRRLPADEADLPALRSQMQRVLGQSVEVLEALVATACQDEGDRAGPPAGACNGLQNALANSSKAMDMIHGTRGGSQGAVEAPGKNEGKDQEPPAQGQGKDKDPPSQGQGKDKEPPATGKGKDKEPPAQGLGNTPSAQGSEAESPAHGNSTSGNGNAGK